jgi:hypothetical protein
LKQKNLAGETPLSIIKKNLEKVKKLRNKIAEVFEDEIISFLEDPKMKPFALMENFVRSGTSNRKFTQN